jgi:aspartate/methionine/tyrosine aminotransferase
VKRVRTDERFLPVPENIEMSIGKRTKAVVLVSPNNPTGMAYPRKLLEEVLEICIDRSIWLISDETYEGYNYDTPQFSPGSFGEDAPVISLFSLSKNFSLSGWRIGYMSYPSTIHEGLLKVQDTTVICPSRISQKVALHCMRDRPDQLMGHIGSFKRSRDVVDRWMRGLDGTLYAPRPSGAYYSFPRIVTGDHAGGSMKLVERILEETNVLLVPGAPFGADDPPHFRISYGNVGTEELKEALDRLAEFFEA